MQGDNLITIEGRNVVLEALKSGRNIKKIYLEEFLKGMKIDSLISLAQRSNVSVEFVSRNFLKSISKTKSSQGVIALADRVSLITSTKFLEQVRDIEEVCVVVLHSLTYEQNLGAILRSCAASGVEALAIPKGRKTKITPVVERISMGGINEVSIIQESFYSVISNLKKEGFRLIALEVTGKKEYFNEDLTGRMALIVGKEDETLDKNLLNKVDITVKIPMIGKISSLNVSVATGIVLFERLRQMYGNIIR